MTAESEPEVYVLSLEARTLVFGSSMLHAFPALFSFSSLTQIGTPQEHRGQGASDKPMRQATEARGRVRAPFVGGRTVRASRPATVLPRGGRQQ